MIIQATPVAYSALKAMSVAALPKNLAISLLKQAQAAC